MFRAVFPASPITRVLKNASTLGGGGLRWSAPKDFGQMFFPKPEQLFTKPLKVFTICWEFFVTNFVTLVTNLLIRVINFVTHITKFVIINLL